MKLELRRRAGAEYRLAARPAPKPEGEIMTTDLDRVSDAVAWLRLRAAVRFFAGRRGPARLPASMPRLASIMSNCRT